MENITNVVHPFLEERYFERMSASMGDKVKILSYLPPVVAGVEAPKVLDVGAGGGEFSNTLSELGYNVTAIDASDDAVMRIREKFPHITTAKFLANHVDELGLEQFDAVVCSSILHEVFSYSNDMHGVGNYNSLYDALQAFYKVLKYDGVLIIRDGVLPENWEDKGTIKLLEGHDLSNVYRYLDMCPFAGGNSGVNNLVNLTLVGDRTFAGNVRSLLEFSYTYTWGVDSFPRETQELYAVQTLKEYCELLTAENFEVIYSESYLQPGYPEHLVGVIQLTVDGVVDNWFDSNAIWVAKKV